MSLAEENGLPLPPSAFGQQLWKAAGRHAEKDGSISNMVRWVEKMTGIEIKL